MSTTAETVEPGKPSVSLVPILSVNFVGSLGFSIVLPFLVFLVTRWGGNALIYGVMGATYSLFQKRSAISKVIVPSDSNSSSSGTTMDFRCVIVDARRRQILG